MAGPAPDTLVTYVFRYTDAEAYNNLFFFISQGIQEGALVFCPFG